MHKDLHEANRLSWNVATRAHNSHKINQADFLRRGGSTLFPEERMLLGDIRNLHIAHLQCNAGQDSLSLAALGAQVTGVDISDEAIDFARRLSLESDISANFIRADVYDWLDEEASTHPAAYDIVFLPMDSFAGFPILTPGPRVSTPFSSRGGPLCSRGISPLCHVP